MTRHQWTPEQEATLLRMKTHGATDREVAVALGLDSEQVRWKRRTRGLTVKDLVSASPFPEYREPLVMYGDALVLPDVELPFHDADFLNKVLELAQRWNVRKCIVAGDLLHLSSISHWGPNWITSTETGVGEKHLDKLIEFANKLSASKRVDMMELVQSMSESREEAGLSVELEISRKVVRELSDLFDEVHLVLGNHEKRLMSALDTAIVPQELLVMLRADEGKWKTSPYYYSRLVSNDQTYQIEHPNSSAKNAAHKLATIHQCHILMAHSHRWLMERDPSGSFWAIQMGHIVDENRLPYASQRHSTTDRHLHGAVIVRDGYPFLLSEDSPFGLL